MAKFSWLADPSDETLRAALRSAVPALADLPIVRNNWDGTSNPEWQSATARLDERLLVKFGWSEPTARRLAHEGRVHRRSR